MWLNLLYLFAATDLQKAACTTEKGKKLLGIIPKWYEYLPYVPDSNGKCAVHFNTKNLRAEGLTDGIINPFLGIGLALADMLLRIAGLVAVGFIIYGGIKYITSQGEPENTRSALNTILNALIGLVIAIIATGTVSFIAGRLG